MSLRERILTILGVIAVVGLVVYPLAHRISTGQASASAPPASAIPTPGPALITIPASPTPAPTPEPVVEGGEPWMATAEVHRGEDGQMFAYTCPPDGVVGPVWGSFAYTDDSSVCTAAVHSGIITSEDGGTIDIVILGGDDAYQGSNQNGVESMDREAHPGGFAVVAPAR